MNESPRCVPRIPRRPPARPIPVIKTLRSPIREMKPAVKACSLSVRVSSPEFSKARRSTPRSRRPPHGVVDLHHEELRLIHGQDRGPVGLPRDSSSNRGVVPALRARRPALANPDGGLPRQRLSSARAVVGERVRLEGLKAVPPLRPAGGAWPETADAARSASGSAPLSLPGSVPSARRSASPGRSSNVPAHPRSGETPRDCASATSARTTLTGESGLFNVAPCTPSSAGSPCSSGRWPWSCPSMPYC